MRLLSSTAAHAGGATCVAAGSLAGAPLVASGGYDGAVRLWRFDSDGALHEFANVDPCGDRRGIHLSHPAL